jgi:predicted GNAT family N-acyltransferase
MYTNFRFQNSTFCYHSAFTCFVQMSEQTALISLYSINWFVFIIETECVYCAVRSGSLNEIQVNWIIFPRSAHTVFTCLVRIWDQTAIISLYSITWLVFVIETEFVYCAVRTGSLNEIQVNWIIFPRSAHTVFTCLVRIWDQTSIQFPL